MGGRSSHHTHSVQYVPNPATEQKLAAVQAQLAKVEAQARAAGDPKLYSTNAANLMNTFVEKLHELPLTQCIPKGPNERHIGVIGDISCGKSTFLNVSFGLSLATALGHCTTECKPVHRVKRAIGDAVYWDVPGKNDSFRFYIAENLSFIKSLDLCIVLYDNDISMISDVLRVVSKLCPTRMLVVRTKLDQYSVNNVRSPAEEKVRDTTQITNVLGYAAPLYFVSANNVRDGRGSRHDWDALHTEITK